MLEIGAGAGRNTRALVAAGVPVVSTSDADPITHLPGGRAVYGAALSTHGLLHGESSKLRLALAELRRVLKPDAVVLATLGSIEDARYGLGFAFDERTFAAGEGPEAGIPHAYFDRDGVIELFAVGFAIDEMRVVDVDEIAGRWAHAAGEPGGRRHWYIQARRS